MRSLVLVAILSAASCSLFGSDDSPQMTSVSVKTVKPGEVFTVEGVGLDSKKIDEVYLTDQKFDMRIKVLEQHATSMKLRVPPVAKPGRVQLMILIKGDEAAFLEQPLYLVIEDAATEVGQVKEPAKSAPKQ